MVLSIRSREIDELARELARLTKKTDYRSHAGRAEARSGKGEGC
jgi:hypothetical protein